MVHVRMFVLLTTLSIFDILSPSFDTHCALVADLFRFECLVIGDEVIGIQREP